MIILTAAQANIVRGPTSNGAMLIPVQIKGGSYILPEETLSDPDHVIRHSFLETLPRREVSPDEFLKNAED